MPEILAISHQERMKLIGYETPDCPIRAKRQRPMRHSIGTKGGAGDKAFERYVVPPGQARGETTRVFGNSHRAIAMRILISAINKDAQRGRAPSARPAVDNMRRLCGQAEIDALACLADSLASVVNMKAQLRTALEAVSGLADQGLSSMTNLVLSVSVARAVAPSEFGVFALGMAAYWMTLTVARSITSQPLVARYSAAEDATWREAATSSLGAVVVIGLLCAFGLAVAGIVVAGALGSVLFAIATCLPALVLRDGYRFAFFAKRRGRSAFLNQLLWSVLLLSGLTAATLLAPPSVITTILIWGASGAIATAVAILQARLVPRPMRAWGWWRGERDIAVPYAAEAFVTTATGQIYLYGVAAIAGISAVAAVRGAEVILGVLQVVLQGAQLTAVPQGVHALRTSPDRLRSRILSLGIALATLSALWGAAAILLPENVGSFLLGSTWPRTHEVLVPMTLLYVAGSASVAASVGLRALAAAARSLRASAIGAVIVIVGATGGSNFGATGAAWGLAVGGLLHVAVFWRQFNVALDDYVARLPVTGSLEGRARVRD
jgi:hypothetical protein